MFDWFILYYTNAVLQALDGCVEATKLMKKTKKQKNGAEA